MVTESLVVGIRPPVHKEQVLFVTEPQEVNGGTPPVFVSHSLPPQALQSSNCSIVQVHGETHTLSPETDSQVAGAVQLVSLQHSSHFPSLQYLSVEVGHWQASPAAVATNSLSQDARQAVAAGATGQFAAALTYITS